MKHQDQSMTVYIPGSLDHIVIIPPPDDLRVPHMAAHILRIIVRGH